MHCDPQGPLMSIEVWKNSEKIEPTVPDHVAEERYGEYKAQYMEHLKDAFFDVHCDQEWFRRRYGPADVADNLDALKAWAQTESAVFAAQARAEPGAFIRSADLGPNAGDYNLLI